MRCVLIFVVYIFFIQFSYAQRISYEDHRITVGIRIEPPFVFKDDEAWEQDEKLQSVRDIRFIREEEMKYFEGLSIDTWEGVAKELKIPFEYRLYDNSLSLLRALQYNEIDVAINPWEVSSTRLRAFEITQPFFISSLGVASLRVYGNQFQLILSNMFSWEFLNTMLTLFSVITVFGVMIWFFEKDYNSEEFGQGLKGAMDGVWWSIVTLATVGYGDKVPKTAWGRAIATLWMFTTIVTISSLTASISSSLTVNRLETRIDSIDDLKKIQRIGTVGATACEDYLKNHGINPDYSYDTPLQGIQALAEGKIDVFIFDKPVMRYLINEHHLATKINILPVTFHRQYRSFLLPKNSDLVDKINSELVDRISRNSWLRVLKKYNLNQEE